MARRELQEINAGSMADIAFLLLIFFLVTTTMEVDAGIGRLLPLKRELPEGYVPPPVHDRDVLEIKANSRDELLVEGELTLIEDLEEIVYDFYTININGEVDESMPTYSGVDVAECQKQIAGLKGQIEENPDETLYKDELGKWETKLELCRELPNGRYDEMYKMAMIRLENQAGTTYGLYIKVHNVLKRVVNDLRSKKCEEIWSRDYFALDKKDRADQDLIKKLRILVPERIIEAKIQR